MPQIESIKKFMDTQEYKQRKEALNFEINFTGRLVINREIFHKDVLDKILLKNAKKAFSKLKNNPEAHKQSRITFIKAILESETPNWDKVNFMIKGEL